MSDPKAFNCPSCGAPLSIKGSEVEITCQFCGTHVLVPEELRAKPAAPVAPQINVQPKIVIVSPYAALPTMPYRARRRGCSGIVFTVCVLVALIGYNVTKNPALSRQLLSVISSGSSAVNSGGVGSGGAVSGSGAVVSGAEGSDPGQFKIARHFAIDSSGNFYVVDLKTFRIQKFDANGKYVSSWNVDQGKATYGPDALAADKDGNVYAVEDGVILKYDGASSKLLGKFTGNSDHFYGIALTPQGTLWAISAVNAADFDKPTLVHLDTQGKVLDRISNPIGPQMDSSSYAAWEINLAISKPGNIYALVRDSIHPKVLEFSPDGKKLLAKFGDGGDTPGKFSVPTDIAVDDQDRVYVSEYSRVQMFDSDGRYLKNFMEARALAASALLYNGKGTMYMLGYDAIYKYGVASTTSAQ